MKTFPLFFLIFISQTLFSQVTFQKTFNVPGDGISVAQTRNGDYLIYGISNYLTDSSAFLLKTDTKGDSVWFQRFAGNLQTVGFPAYNNALINTKDNGFLILSTYYNGNTDTTYLIKRDENGNNSWNKKIVGLRSLAVLQTGDGGFVLSGIDVTHRATILKTNSSGQELWRKWTSDIIEGYYGYIQTAFVNSIIETLDGSFVSEGYLALDIFKNPTSINKPQIPYDLIHPFMIKADSTGDTLWSKKVPYFPYLILFSVKSTPTNEIVAIGVQDSLIETPFIHMNGLLIQFDQNGDTIWTKTYGSKGNQELYSLEKTEDGGFISCGSSNPDATISPPFGYEGLYLVRMNSIGDTLWTKYYPGGQNGLGNVVGVSVKETSDHGFIACGYQIASISVNASVFLIKTDGLGNVYPQGINESNNLPPLEIFPNPSSGKVYLNLPGKFTSLTVSDIFGKQVLQRKIDPNDNNTQIIDLIGNQDGVYVLQVWNETDVRTGKIVLKGNR